jgi:hypothetical protein
MNLEQHIAALQRNLNLVVSARVETRDHRTVLVTSEFIELLQGILDVAKHEMLTRDEWFVIYMALRSDPRGNSMHEELAAKINKWQLNRVQKGLV